MPSYSGIWTLSQQMQAVGQGNWQYPPIGAEGIALFAGGRTTGDAAIATISQVQLSTLGNATSFGNLSAATAFLSSCSSSTRGIFMGGGTGATGDTVTSAISYVTIASAGNATSFGNLTVARYQGAGCSSSTRGIFGGGYGADFSNVLDYITIATAGNATDFGDLLFRPSGVGACASSTRGVWAGGYAVSAFTNTINYVTIATTGNATDFGDLLANGSSTTGCSNSTRGLFVGFTGAGNLNAIQYITIDTTGNAVDFGDLTFNSSFSGGAASTTTAYFAGVQSPLGNTINYVTIATTGNAVDFGDLTVNSYGLAACSNAHGGL